MALRLANRLQRLPSQFFAALVQTAQQRLAAGHDVINLGQGNPDQPTPPHVVAHLQRVATDPETHRYSRFSGLAELKQAISQWYRERFQVHLDPEQEVCILIGSKAGLQEISLCLLDPGDACLVPDPGYPDYLSGIALAGGIPLPLPLRPENNYLPDLGVLPQAVLQRARLMFLNYPCNPTGAVAPTSYLQDALAFAARHGLVLAYDAAYVDLVYDRRQPTSLLTLPGAREVAVEFHTLSKSYNMAGWRIGFCAGSRAVIQAINLIQDHLHCSQFPAIQLAAAHALLGPQTCVTHLRQLYEERRNAYITACQEVGWPVSPPAGTFFVWCPVPGGGGSMPFAQRLLDEANVVVAPGTAFGPCGEGYVRIALTTGANRLVEAVRRIAQVRSTKGSGGLCIGAKTL